MAGDVAPPGGGNLTPQGFAVGVLKSLGAPVTPQNVAGLVGWARAEGGAWNNSAHYNPLNTTQGAPGASSINSVGVKSYNNWQEGINATVQTLRNGNYGGILAALHTSNPTALANAIANSPWGTSGSLVRQTIAQALGEKMPIPKGVSLPGGATSAGVTVPKTITTGGGTNVTAAIEQALLSTAAAPISASGGGGGDLLSAIMNNINSGQYTNPTHTVTVGGSKAPSLPAGALSLGKGGDVNPLPGWTIGRTDMGVDANAKPGAPIRAMNDSRVVHIYPNWYAGQPYVLLQLTSGPNAGKYWYVAEQINNLPHVGQIIPRGGVVATYAPSGTGIEIGWGTPGWQTLAQSQGDTGGPDHSDSPAGQNFAHTFGL